MLTLMIGVGAFAPKPSAAEVGVIAGTETSTPRTLRAYGKPNQTRLWYNAFENRWDALVPRDSAWWSNGDLHIVSDIIGSQTFSTATLGDDDDDRPDVFWDEQNSALYVLSSHPRRSEFWLVEYDRRKKKYELAIGEAGAGIEVPGLNHPDTRLGGNSPATIFVSPNGRIWASVMRENALLVQVSSDKGRSWLPAPVRLDENVSVGVTTWACFIHDGTTYAGLFAGENGSPSRASRFFYWYIAENADPASPGSWVDDSDNIPAPEGREQSDDHVSAAIDAATNQYFAVKTENGNDADPLISLYKRTPAGRWFQFPVTRTGEVPEQSRPSITIDNEQQRIHIYTNGAEIVDEDSRVAGRFTANLNALSELENAEFTPIFNLPNTVFTDVITPRHPINSRSGIVVLAHHRSDSAIWFGANFSATTSMQTAAEPALLCRDEF